MTLRFNREFDPAHGEAVELAPGILRVTVNNPSPFTFQGTNTYIVGAHTLAIIDPGPEDPDHLQVLLRAIGRRPVSHVLVTHTHGDHSPLARHLRERTGGLLVGALPASSGSSPLDAGLDAGFVPDMHLQDNALIEGDGWALEAIATPGHASNHFVFALKGEDILFSGDHVMGWATSVVAPPDGSMADYLQSLDRLLARRERRYLPGHGGAISEPRKYLRGLKAHRRMRERAIVERLASGDRSIEELVAAIYRDIHPGLRRAAGFSVLAHLEHLLDKGQVRRNEEGWKLADPES